MENLKVLITEKELQQRIEELAKQIYTDYEGKEICSFSAFDTMNEDSRISDSDIRYIE